jgi:hypothetical protein
MCACGQEFKARSESGAEQCWSCHLSTVEADYLEHAAKVEAMPVPAWAEGDPFVGLDGGELSAYSNHGKWSKDPHRAVRP